MDTLNRRYWMKGLFFIFFISLAGCINCPYYFLYHSNATGDAISGKPSTKKVEGLLVLRQFGLFFGQRLSLAVLSG